MVQQLTEEMKKVQEKKASLTQLAKVQEEVNELIREATSAEFLHRYKKQLESLLAHLGQYPGGEPPAGYTAMRGSTRSCSRPEPVLAERA